LLKTPRVYLFLTPLTQSWAAPAAVTLWGDTAGAGGLLLTWLMGLDNNVYTQIGLVMLIGLASKNAILIVEFAKQLREEGNPIQEAAATAARIRFRAVLMTAFSFILGIMPLVLATGAGAASQVSLGIVVLGGMLAATVIDASDGWLARRARVERVLPGFSGRRLDDIVDVHTYTSLPLLLLWRSGVLAPEHAPWLLLPLLASAYGFSQAEAKTPDGFFLGFPSYWNVVALYLFLLRPPPAVALALVLGFTVLTIVPAKYLYPSQPGPLRAWTLALGAVWGAMVLAMLLVPTPPRALVLVSLFFPAYYQGASWAVSLAGGRGSKRP
jgi:phosphatidylcholine synthase